MSDSQAKVPDPTVPAERLTEPAAPPEAVASEELLKGMRELLIRHAGEIYRLRLTRNGKLILHK